MHNDIICIYGWKICNTNIVEFINNTFDKNEVQIIISELKILLKEVQIDFNNDEDVLLNDDIECVIPNLIIDYDIDEVYIGKIGDDNKTPKQWAMEVRTELLESKIPELLKNAILHILNNNSPRWIIYN